MIEALENMEAPSITLLAGWFFFLLISCYTYFKKSRFTNYFLFAAAICIAAAFALFSPWLYMWDEQFHALVAKNLSHHPLVPKLYPNHPLAVEQSWLSTEIWMHKQPLFTWQMALSIKLFGANAFAARLPSVLFHGFLVLAIFRIGTIVFNRTTGFVAALFALHSAFLLGLISGRIGTDHNDYIFLCYITFSFWAWFEWDLSSHKKWLYYIGILAGCAILTKWLVGLLVFAGWGIVVLSQLRQKKFWVLAKPILLSFGVALLVAMPWQIYTFLRFPVEAKQEMAYNSAHVFHAIESHTGNAWYHFERLRDLYFNPVDFLIFFTVGLLFLLFAKIKREYKIYFVVSICIVYLFFTVVQTKMPAFTAPVYSLVLLVVAYGCTKITRLIQYRWVRKTTLVLIVLLVVNLLLKPSPTLSHYGFHKDQVAMQDRGKMLKALNFMKSQGKSSGKRVVFGIDFFPFAHISWMFFNDEIAYPFVPSKEEVEALEREGYEVVVY